MLKRCIIVLSGKFSLKQSEIEERIAELGGQVLKLEKDVLTEEIKQTVLLSISTIPWFRIFSFQELLT